MLILTALVEGREAWTGGRSHTGFDAQPTLVQQLMGVRPPVGFQGATADAAEFLGGDDLHEMTVSSDMVAQASEIPARRVIVLVAEPVRIRIMCSQHA